MENGGVDVAAVKLALKDFKDPESGRDVVTMEQVSDVQVSDGRIALTLGLTTHSAAIWDETFEQAAAHLRQAFPKATDVTVNRAVHDRPPERIGEVGLSAKSVIAVGSGKGGVGKSTVATVLAYGLSQAGSQVGLMDADVYGPSIPHLLGAEGRVGVQGENKIVPLEKDGIRVISMGFLVPPGEAVIWRGPMLHRMIMQFLGDTLWGELDYLIIDLPPGTGDIALTLSQLLPLTGSVVVCTPQEVALLDAVKAIAMFRKVNIPLLGMVENMSGFVCPDCEKRHEIFGSGGAARKAQELDVPFLGEIPINLGIRIHGDEGEIRAVFDDPATQPYLEKLTRELVRNLAQRSVDEPPLPTLSVL